MSEKLLHRYLNGTITDAEMKQLQDSPEYKDYLKIAQRTAEMHPPQMDETTVWNSVHQKTQQEKPVKTVSVWHYSSLLKYAAILVLFVLGYWYVTGLDATVSSEVAQKRDVALPDSSEVVLNAASKITYHPKSWQQDRNLQLEGEAFFKVIKGAPFSVHTNQGKVEVLGTSFNVQSRKDHFHISCYEGRVAVAFQNDRLELAAGESAIIENGRLKSRQKITGKKPGWMENESSFTDVPLQLVLEELQRQYDVQLHTKQVDQNKRFTGAFSHDNLKSALKTITVPLQLTYSIKNNTVTLYGK